MWLTQIEMDLAWKRNGIIGLQRCLHWLLSTLSSLSLELPSSATVPAQRAPGIGSMHYQGAREQTRVLRLEQKVFYWLTYFPSLISFLSKWRCSKETKSRTPKRGKHPKGGIVHTPLFETGSYVAQAVLEHAMLQMIHGITGLRHHVSLVIIFHTDYLIKWCFGYTRLSRLCN